MNLVELYQETPVEKHKDTRVIGNRVFVRDEDGDITEYLELEDGELWFINSDKKLKADVGAIKKKLGA